MSLGRGSFVMWARKLIVWLISIKRWERNIELGHKFVQFGLRVWKKLYLELCYFVLYFLFSFFFFFFFTNIFRETSLLCPFKIGGELSEFLDEELLQAWQESNEFTFHPNKSCPGWKPASKLISVQKRLSSRRGWSGVTSIVQKFFLHSRDSFPVAGVLYWSGLRVRCISSSSKRLNPLKTEIRLAHYAASLEILVTKSGDPLHLCTSDSSRVPK